MAILQRLARLTADDLTVEAGTSAETSIELGPFVGATDEEVREYAVRVDGLPSTWFTVSADVIRLSSGQQAELLLVIHPPQDDTRFPLGLYDFAVTLASAEGDEPIVLPARVRALAPGAYSMRSRLLQYLPSIFQDDAFLARFLLIFQSVLDPIEQMVDNTHHYLDPGLAPASFLPWLAAWAGVTLDPGLDESRQRTLIRRAVELSRWKGTRRGLREELEIRTLARPLIVENFDGMRLGQDAALGMNTHLGDHREGSIAVTFAADGTALADQARVEELVAELKPAHVGHVVRVVRAPKAGEGESSG
jgi:phage tail-like protein